MHIHADRHRRMRDTVARDRHERRNSAIFHILLSFRRVIHSLRAQRACMHGSWTCTRTYTIMLAYMHLYVHAFICTNIRARAQRARTCTHTQIAYKHTHTNTYTLTHIRLCLLKTPTQKRDNKILCKTKECTVERTRAKAGLKGLGSRVWG